MKLKIHYLGLLLFFQGWQVLLAQPILPATDWPAITNTQQPWTRWWWHGSSVKPAELTREMEAYKQAGIGGLELTPIFGVIGKEDQFVDYLSPEWMLLFDHSLKEAQRLGLGMDMATGTGWPFGGPWVQSADAPKTVLYKTYHLQGGERLEEEISYMQEPLARAVTNQLYQLYGLYQKEGEISTGSRDNPVEINRNKRLEITDLVEPISANKNLQGLALDQVRFEKRLTLQALMAYSQDGQVVDLTYQLSRGKLNWEAPPGDWMLYAVFQGWHGKMVERAAPGGEGHTIDHFSGEAIKHYLARFDSAFAGHDISYLRAFFNDSYEVDDAQGNADWTQRLFAEFQKRRGYPLQHHLPALFGEAGEEENARVLMDYRETLSDLLLEKFTEGWRDWAHEQGAIVRNQSHGSPANILDLYAASDIPETEGTQPLMIRFAASAAHLGGRSLASAEAATWLNEHFLSSLADLRRNLERYWLNGINHVFYHGTSYSSADEPWPGRLFYAATHVNPRNPLWRDLPTLNQYVARVQSFLQAGQPANDVLLYFPIFDRWAERGREGMIEHFHGSEPGFERSAMKEAAGAMYDRGYAFDYISDRQIQQLSFGERGLTSGELAYRTIVLPDCHYLPLETWSKLAELVSAGATVIVHRSLPHDVNGREELAERQAAFNNIKAQLSFTEAATGIQSARLGAGAFLMGEDLDKLLAYAQVQREPLVDQGLQFTRRSHADGHHYYVANWKEEAVDGWIKLGVTAQSAYLFDPMTGEKGLAQSRVGENGQLEVLVQIPAGESIIVKTFRRSVSGEAYAYRTSVGEAQPLEGRWVVNFVSGGPELPPNVTLEAPASWTTISGDAYQAFSGTATYTLNFRRPKGKADGWLLDLGEVAVSAGVNLNGREVGTLIGPNYQVYLPRELFKKRNTLEVTVTNLMANRIADLDKKEVFWKKFYNVNFPARLAENREEGLFTAAHWAPRPSGLLGPVTLRLVDGGR